MAGTNQTTTLHLLAPLSQHTSTVGLVLAGMSLGLVHVLSGPDHLSALATLSVSHDPFQAFSLGVRWGVGHSFGLLLVAALFLGMKGDLNLSRLEYYGELLVGIFMLLMGSAALFSAVGTRQMELAQGQAALEDKDKKFAGEDELEGLLLLLLPAESGEVDNHNQQQHAVLEEHCSCLNLENERTRRMASLGVLGVMPAVALNDNGKAAIYLAAFCGTSIFVMGLFASLYGHCTSRCGDGNSTVTFVLTAVSALFSLVVGSLWLWMVIAFGRVPF